ncbi:MAG: hypothetical protein LBH13_05535 [Cellulomonadaceae bacterium]|nr:hypothetical protein [Cellulomonadaceae bacterium]
METVTTHYTRRIVIGVLVLLCALAAPFVFAEATQDDASSSVEDAVLADPSLSEVRASDWEIATVTNALELRTAAWEAGYPCPFRTAEHNGSEYWSTRCTSSDAFEYPLSERSFLDQTTALKENHHKSDALIGDRWFVAGKPDHLALIQCAVGGTLWHRDSTFGAWENQPTCESYNLRSEVANNRAHSRVVVAAEEAEARAEHWREVGITVIGIVGFLAIFGAPASVVVVGVRRHHRQKVAEARERADAQWRLAREREASERLLAGQRSALADRQAQAQAAAERAEKRRAADAAAALEALWVRCRDEADLALFAFDERIDAAEEEAGFAEAFNGEDAVRDVNLSITQARRAQLDAARLQRTLTRDASASSDQREKWSAEILALVPHHTEALEKSLVNVENAG